MTVTIRLPIFTNDRRIFPRNSQEQEDHYRLAAQYKVHDESSRQRKQKTDRPDDDRSTIPISHVTRRSRLFDFGDLVIRRSPRRLELNLIADLLVHEGGCQWRRRQNLHDVTHVVFFAGTHEFILFE